MSKPIKMLDINAPDFAEQLHKAMGLKPGEKVQIITPQFTRTDGLVVSYIPQTAAEFEMLKMLRQENLKKIGCQVWDSDRFKTHWLYPSEWYSSIPDGLEIVSISGEKKKFISGQTDNDIRHGALAYGFIQEHYL